MLSPQGYHIGKDPRAKNPFWDEGESADVRRIFATASVDNNVGTPQVQTSKTISGNDIIFGFDFKNLKGRPGNDGAPGEPGTPGSDGVDGFSPIANVEQTADGATITVTDKNGTTSAVVRNGRDGTDGTDGTDGAPGANGFSPVVNVTQTPTGAVVSVTDETGTTEATISNGERGSDGVSPTASVEQTADGATVTVTDAQGTTTANLRNGRDGTDGLSPTASVTQTQTGATVTVTDAQGTTTAELTNGTDGVSPTASVEQTGTNEVTFSVTDAQGTTTARLTGQAGAPGVSPTVTITDITGGHRVTVTDANGSRYFDVMDGTPGQNGSDGFSPTVAITDITGGHRVTVTDANGSQSFDVMDGTPGQQGTPGVGVPAGGTAGQVLAKVDGTDYNTEWITPQGGGGASTGVTTVPIAAKTTASTLQAHNGYEVFQSNTMLPPSWKTQFVPVAIKLDASIPSGVSSVKLFVSCDAMVYDMDYTAYNEITLSILVRNNSSGGVTIPAGTSPGSIIGFWV